MNRQRTSGWWELPLVLLPIVGMALLALITCLTGCGGTPFTLEQTAVDTLPPTLPPVATAQSPQDSGAEANEDAGKQAPDQDSGDEHAAEGSAAEAIAPDVGVEAEVDAGVDVAPEAAPGCSGTVPTTPFGCGNSGFTMPTQYCVYQSGGTAADSVVGLPTPLTCQCHNTYTCECLLGAAASKDKLCAPGWTYVSCSVGTTGGVVVNCK
jgi:hypothetical protein